MTAVYYEGPGASASARARSSRPGPGEVRIDVRLLRRVRHRRPHRPRPHGSPRPRTAGDRTRDVGHHREVGAGGRSLCRRRPPSWCDRSTRRGETARGQGRESYLWQSQVPRIDTPGAFQSSWTVPAFTLHRCLPAADLQLAALVERWPLPATTAPRLVLPGESAVVIGGGRSPPRRVVRPAPRERR